MLKRSHLSQFLRLFFLLPSFHIINCISSPLKVLHNSEIMARKVGANFQDLLPVMAEKLGGDGLIKELCNGFEVLMDKEKGVITLESLRRNSWLLGVRDMGNEELLSMMREGDLDGDGALNQMEFCVLMFRLSPDLMEHSLYWLQHAFETEFN